MFTYAVQQKIKTSTKSHDWWKPTTGACKEQYNNWKTQSDSGHIN